MTDWEDKKVHRRGPKGRIATFFSCVAGVVITLILAITFLAGYTLRVASSKTDAALDIVRTSIDSLPELLETSTAALGNVLNDPAGAAYASQLDIEANFPPQEAGRRWHPTITVQNNGDQIVSYLAVRVVALDEENRPLHEWTEVVATPVALEEDGWRGVLLPGQTRYAVGNGTRLHGTELPQNFKQAVEISGIALWDAADFGKFKPISTALAD
jgi:hypothetical protein